MRFLFLISLIIAGSIDAQIQSAEKFHYLMLPTANSVQVQIHTDDKINSSQLIKVSYKPNSSPNFTTVGTTSFKTTSSPTTFIYTIPLTGLSAETLYTYRTSIDGGLHWGSEDTFQTAPLPGTAFTFGAYSDTRDLPLVHGGIAQKVFESGATMVMQAGDIALNYDYKTLLTYFVPRELNLIRHAPLFYTPGNHEFWPGTYPGYTRSTPAKSANTKAFFGPGDYDGWGFFDYGDLHIVMIHLYKPMTEAFKQLIRDDLKNSKKPWKVALYHEPAYVWHTGINMSNKIMREVSEQCFHDENGNALIDFTISGHAHFYQHNVVRGIHHFIIGSAGTSKFNISDGHGGETKRTASTQCYGIFRVTPTSLTGHVYDYTRNTEILDTDGGPALHLAK